MTEKYSICDRDIKYLLNSIYESESSPEAVTISIGTNTLYMDRILKKEVGGSHPKKFRSQGPDPKCPTSAHEYIHFVFLHL